MTLEIVSGQFFDASINDEKSCRALFAQIASVDANILPISYGKNEPLRQKFALDAMAREWCGGLFWKGRRPVSDGSFWPEDDITPFDTVYASVDGVQWAEKLRAVQLRWAQLFSMHFGYVHGVDDAHAQLREYRTRIMPFDGGLSWSKMEKRLPCVAWSMLFGPAYVQKIGRDRLLSAPCFSVTESAAGIGMQVTRSIHTLLDDYPAYRRERDALVRHLGPDVVAPVDAD